MNASIRNFRKKLTALSLGNSINITGRKLLTLRKIDAICIGVRKVANHWRKMEELTETQKIKNIENDIWNGQNHYFGDHQKCSGYFCSKDKESNLLPTLQKSGIYTRIMEICNRMARNTRSLLYNLNNNDTEHFNSLIAK